MKKLLFKKHIFPCFILLLACTAKAQKDSLSLSERLKNIEDYKDNFRTLYQIDSTKLSILINTKIDDKTKDLNDAHSKLNWILYLGLPVTLLAIAGTYITAIRKAKNLVDNRIEDIVERKREEIIKLIETQEFDTGLKKTKKILIISPDEDSQDFIKTFFERFKGSVI